MVTVALPCANAMSELSDAQATGTFPAFGMLLLLPARNLQEPSWHTHMGIYGVFSSKTQIKATGKKRFTPSMT